METPTTPRYPIFRPDAVPFVTGNGSFDKSRIRGYTPQMIMNAYGFGGTLDASGMNIAVIEAFENLSIQKDIDEFSSEFGLPSTTLDVYYPDGRSGYSTREWVLESALDTQWVHALAPQAKISVVFAKDESIQSLHSAVTFAVGLGVDVVSMSYGTPEFISQGEISEYFANSGKTFVAAAGDEGGKVFFPSTSPYTLSVGGTNLSLAPDGSRTSPESAWQFGGGGPSKYANIPPWQMVFGDIDKMSDSHRATPDTAFYASSDPGVAVYLSILENTKSGGWTTASGTSFSAASMGAICVSLLKKRPPSMSGDNVQRYFYALAGGTKYDLPQYYFNDVTIGSNGVYSAKIGWDFCTGLGTARVRQVLKG